MCRWIAYTGDPVFMDSLVTKPHHSLVEQSFNARLQFRADGSLWSTNGDGFGIGWYDEKEEPGLFKDFSPAWNNINLHEICSQIKAHTFLAHVRASTHGDVQRNNSHPFKYKNWLFQHNGTVGNFQNIKRGLRNLISDELYPFIAGNTDSETVFYLALTYGLENDPKGALEKALGSIKSLQEESSLEEDISFSCAVTNGRDLFSVCYSSPYSVNKSQFYTTDMSMLRYVVGKVKTTVDYDVNKCVIIVSEPLDYLGSRWERVPESSFVSIKDGKVDISFFSVQAP